jgi:hypothetical protein
LWNSEDVVRTVTRTVLTTGALLIGVGAAAGQAPGGVRPAVLITQPPPAPPGARSPVVVIQRLISFDANADRRVSRDELPERMQELVARGDRNADAALDSDEIVALVDAASTKRIRFSSRIQPSEGLPGVINDLKLPREKHARALEILSAHKPSGTVRDPASKEFYAEMESLLDNEEYENFVAAAARLSRSAASRFHTGDGVVGGVAGGLFAEPPVVIKKVPK